MRSSSSVVMPSTSSKSTLPLAVSMEPSSGSSVNATAGQFGWKSGKGMTCLTVNKMLQCTIVEHERAGAL